MTSTKITSVVMRRVRTIHALRTAASGAGLSFLVLAGSLYLIGREVWVSRVFENMPSADHVVLIARFFAAAFVSTDLIVQILTVLSLAAVVWLLREVGRVVTIQTTRFA